MNTVVAFDHSRLGHNRLDYIKRRIMEAHIRLVKGGSEWVESSLEIAIALREARDAVPSDVSFSGWLKQNNLTYYCAPDRAALIGLAGNIELARTILAESESRSYQLIWRTNKDRFYSDIKPPSPGNRKRRVVVPGRAKLFRTMKLGEEAMNKISGTSLDSSEELDELVILNRGAPEGSLTEVVTRLIDAAANGEPVSAIVEGMAMGGGRRSTVKLRLMEAWKRRMLAPWKLAKPDERAELVRLLLKEFDQERQHNLIERLWDEQEQKKGG